MRKNVLWTLCMSVLVACEQQDLCENESELCNCLRVEAEVSSQPITSRTSTSKGKVTFAENDVIGFYTPKSEKSGSWTYTKGVWSSEQMYTWPDKKETYEFCAYYPFVAAEKRNEITMPLLSRQTGDSNDLSTYDFLVARCSSSYATNKGAVSFTGDKAFHHVYALMVVTFSTNSETKGSTLTSITLNAKDLMTPHTYHFGSKEMDDGMTVAGESVDVLSLRDLTKRITTEGLTQMFVVNPLNSSETVDITIDYSRDGKNYTASTKVKGTTIQEGNLNQLNILIKKSGLVVEGNTVVDWTINDPQDLTVEESPKETPQETSNEEVPLGDA